MFQRGDQAPGRASKTDLSSLDYTDSSLEVTSILMVCYSIFNLKSHTYIATDLYSKSQLYTYLYFATGTTLLSSS
jgi:hypothetical protein